ncbi:MAG: bifunctional molybdopterin-guanine dinucleotide biosynthesis adaptor protein MobB/molybdopterin molybdotransferase MoeA [Paracoccaceae bacterium]
MKIFGVIGWKNAGKTGLMERLVAEITGRGFSVSTIKHAHHSFDVDQPGKDSHRHRMAGAQEVLLASARRWALMHEIAGDEEPPLDALLEKLAPVDLVLVEGFKRGAHPKMEVHRVVNGAMLIAPDDPNVLAIAGDVDPGDVDVPCIDLNDTAAIAGFILSAVALVAYKSPKTTQLRNDCFALPAGVDWIPVDTALATLRGNMQCCVADEVLPVCQGIGRVLAQDIAAPRANPPAANSAVDGYGFAHAGACITSGKNILPLLADRAAAGAPFLGAVPAGQAVRILTGALLPGGVDTVVLQEDVTCSAHAVQFDGAVRAGANTRAAGEDVSAGELALSAGQRLRAPELALLSAVGVADVPVFKKLRVGVLSTGDEIVPAGSDAASSQTYDANRPMLLGLAKQWGYCPVDLEHARDDPGEIASRLDRAASEADVIWTSGGASVGDEDHLSALLGQAGGLFTWRIAIKPGRPLALGMWKNTPVFGLPGNPVAALICTLIFARPALSVLAGGRWLEPTGYEVPAGFSKQKKPGRREYLRARITANGRVEVFGSEGSGRVSGLSWADGLVELGDGARQIEPGDPVRYIPYSSFGL